MPNLKLLKWISLSDSYGVGPFKNSNNQNLKIMPQFNILSDDFYFNLFSDTDLNINKTPSYEISGLFYVKFSEKLNYQNNFTFMSKSLNNKHFKGVKKESLNDWAGYLNSSFISYSYLDGSFLIGKTNIFLNSFSENLLINGNHPPNSAILWNHKFKNKLQYSWGVQFLDGIGEYGRFFAINRLTFLNESFSISFSELSMARFRNFIKDGLIYSLPASILTETEINEGESNLFWFIDGYVELGNFVYYSELLIDDYSLDKKSPNKIAFKLGSILSFARNKIQLDYLRINNWVGNYLYAELQMHDNDVLIGHSLGPDMHRLALEINIPCTNFFVTDLELYIIESGEGEIDTPWPVDLASTNFGYSHEKFPSGISKKTKGLLLNTFYFINSSLTLESAVAYEDKIDISFKIRLIY